MEELLGKIYELFSSLFGENLLEHLSGFDGEDYNKSNGLGLIGIIALGISVFMALIYYYVINHPRYNGLKSWLVVLFINGVINFLVALVWVLSDIDSGSIADTLLHKRDDAGGIVRTLISKGDCAAFGVVNMIVSALFFFLFSMICKWGSRNCKYSPF